MKTKPKPKKVRSAEIRITLTDEEITMFKDRSENLGMTVSTWARMTLRQATGLAS